MGELVGCLDHYPFSKGMTHWLNRHNSYSSLEAQQFVKNRAANLLFRLSQAFFGKDVNQRRLHQKELFYRMPSRPFIKFFLLCVGKRGFLDGSAGFAYAMLQSFYEYMIVLKTKELAGTSAKPVGVEKMVQNHGAGAIPENLYANPGSND